MELVMYHTCNEMSSVQSLLYGVKGRKDGYNVPEGGSRVYFERRA
jgi:hypothetical protein